MFGYCFFPGSTLEAHWKHTGSDNARCGQWPRKASQLSFSHRIFCFEPELAFMRQVGKKDDRRNGEAGERGGVHKGEAGGPGRVHRGEARSLQWVHRSEAGELRLLRRGEARRRRRLPKGKGKGPGRLHRVESG